MNRKMVGIVISMGIFVAGLAGAARAQKSPSVAGMDSALRGAVERKDVPGVVALLTDRRRVLYQGAFGVADVSTGRALTADAQGRFGLDDCRDLLVYCISGRCHHSKTMNADWLADETPVRSLCGRMVCTECGMIGADVRPDWSPHVNKRRV
jgi:hypothetical protein